ncbi:MAG TPA: response regulator transcription factor [bacterium]|nr:response regulator transcription factor [bacterium]
MPGNDRPSISQTRVLLVDDNPGFRQRMARLLELQTDLAVVGEASDGNEAITRVRELHPDVVLMDFRMTGLDGFTAARTITAEFPKVKVFMLTAFPGALDPDKVAKNGIAGLLIKDQPASEILAAIRKSVTR